MVYSKIPFLALVIAVAVNCGGGGAAGPPGRRIPYPLQSPPFRERRHQPDSIRWTKVLPSGDRVDGYRGPK